MLDFDLAEIYWYETKNFNRQVKNNIKKFDEDFMFQLNYDEVLELSRCNFCTSIQVKGIKGGRAYFPYAFTEQGIYMLMTVLRGDLAIKQSKILIRLFKTMKDFIIERENLIGSDEVARLAIQTSQNTKDIARIDQKSLKPTLHQSLKTCSLFFFRQGRCPKIRQNFIECNSHFLFSFVLSQKTFAL